MVDQVSLKHFKTTGEKERRERYRKGQGQEEKENGCPLLKKKGVSDQPTKTSKYNDRRSDDSSWLKELNV